MEKHFAARCEDIRLEHSMSLLLSLTDSNIRKAALPDY